MRKKFREVPPAGGLRFGVHQCASLLAVTLFSTMASVQFRAEPAGGELPGAWFFNARRTGADYVYFTLGGTRDRPPISTDQVRLGWSWIEGGADIVLYPDIDQEVVYRYSDRPDKRARAWTFEAQPGLFPAVGIRPDGELLLLDADEEVGPATGGWEDVLDAIEAAYRQSAPDLTRSQRLAEIEIGLLGGCVVRSVPTSETGQGDRSFLVLPGHARPSRSGGTYLADTADDAGDRAREVRVRRFQRSVENERPATCLAEDWLSLRLFPIPPGATPSSAFFLTIDRLRTRSLPGPPEVQTAEPSGAGPRTSAVNPTDLRRAEEPKMVTTDYLVPLTFFLGGLMAAFLWHRLRRRAVDVEAATDGAGDGGEEALDRALESEDQMRLERLQRLLLNDSATVDRLLTLVANLPEEGWVSLLDPASPATPPRAQEGVEIEVEACFRTLCAELKELPNEAKEHIRCGLTAAGRLGFWIDGLWAAYGALEPSGEIASIPRRLPVPAREEWRSAYDSLRPFAAIDACVYRRLSALAFGEASYLFGPPRFAEVRFLERSGLIGSERLFPDRWRRYLAPEGAAAEGVYAGRLAELVVALQYLVEAYPIEHLEEDRRSAFRRRLAAWLETADLPEDFHLLAEDLASSAGLRYYPVPCYRSRIGDPSQPFLERRFRVISLSERIGYPVTTDPGLVVRLEPPFLFEEDSGEWLCGEALACESPS